MGGHYIGEDLSVFKGWIEIKIEIERCIDIYDDDWRKYDPRKPQKIVEIFQISR